MFMSFTKLLKLLCLVICLLDCETIRCESKHASLPTMLRIYNLKYRTLHVPAGWRCTNCTIVAQELTETSTIGMLVYSCR